MFDFSFLYATFKASSVFFMGCITMVDSAFEKNVTQCTWLCNTRMVEASRNFCRSQNFDGFDEKVEKFTFFEFSFHGTTLEGDVAR